MIISNNRITHDTIFLNNRIIKFGNPINLVLEDLNQVGGTAPI